MCLVYQEGIQYLVRLIWSNRTFTTTVNSSVCVMPLSECSIAFNISLGEIIERNFTISVQAVNSGGNSNATAFNGIISGRLLMVQKCTLYG